jgi:hypothetical protein
MRNLDALLVVSGAAALAGLFVAPERTAGSLSIGAYAMLTVFLGGLVFVAFEYVTGARWSVPFRRVYEALASNLWIAGLAMLAVVALRRDAYAWLPPEGAAQGTFWFKAWWLAPTALVARTAFYVIAWSLLASAIVWISRAQDRTADASLTQHNRRLSAVALLIFAPTFSLAACDWFMSLEPMWFSTVWGAYHFAGLATSTLSVVVLVALHLRRGGHWRGTFTDDHLHDLGKLLLGFSCFWMYLWFCQYMLIWYANIPEETGYFVHRTRGAWGPLLVANVALNWVVPFLALLPRPSKRSGATMARVAGVVLVGRWLDLYLMVYPSGTAEPLWGAWEAASMVFFASASLRLIFAALAKAPLTPVGDPALRVSELHAVCASARVPGEQPSAG